jgi:chromosome segregation ATPase
MDKLMRAKAEQRRLKKHVHKHKKAASEARWEPNQAYVALGNLHSQMEQVDQQRAATEEARADDQARLAGLREQLEAARAEAFIATHQRNLTNNRATSTEAERVRTRAVSAMQDRVERDLRQQLA